MGNGFACGVAAWDNVVQREPCDQSLENSVNPPNPVNPVENSSRREREAFGVLSGCKRLDFSLASRPRMSSKTASHLPPVQHQDLGFVREDPWRIFRIMAEFVD